MLLRGSAHHAKNVINRLLISVTFASLTLGAFFALFYFSTSHVNISSVQAAVPKIISYQAKVTDSSGVTVTDGSYLIKFKLYDASSSGNCLYVASGTCASPTAVTTTITSGVFSVLLGDTSAGFNTLTTSTLASSSVYLGVTIGSDSEMTPRKRLVATPYAMNALSLNGLDPQTDGGTSSYIVAATSTGNIIITGTATSTFTMGATFATSGGTVGIGTSTPRYKLDVVGDISASQGIRDGNAWIGNQAYSDQLARAYNNGGFGSGASPGNLVTTSSDVEIFNVETVNASSTGKANAAFDGRYIYYVPLANDKGEVFTNEDGVVSRYDTTQSFSATSSWSFFDLRSRVPGGESYGTVVFDGHYMYFGQNRNGLGYVTRYDTTLGFTASSSWMFYNTLEGNANAGGYQGAVYDGAYVYFVQYVKPGGITAGMVARYNPALPFNVSSSWTFLDTTTLNANSKGYEGAVFDGHYIYLVPYWRQGFGANGLIARYDVTQNFTDSSSWLFFDTRPINDNSAGFVGAVFDSRYIYFLPDTTDSDYSSQVTRYDTTGSFNATSSWSFFDTALVNSRSKGFFGGSFDGRYLYLVPNYDGTNYSGQFTKYDTTQSFTASSSWSVYDLENVRSGAKGYSGAIFDGKYTYFVPSYTGTHWHGLYARIKSYTGGIDSHSSVNQTATTKDLYLDSFGQIGLGTVLPSTRLTVMGGGLDVGAGLATTTVSSTLFVLNKTATNASGTFFVDQSGNIFASQTPRINGYIPTVNNTYDLGSSAKKWRNIYLGGQFNVSGTLAVGTFNTVDATSTFYHGLRLGVRTGYLDGAANIDTLGNIAASGTITAGNGLSTSINTFTGGLTFYVENNNSPSQAAMIVFQSRDVHSSIITSNFTITDNIGSNGLGEFDSWNGILHQTGRGASFIEMSEGALVFGTSPPGSGTVTISPRMTISRYGLVTIGSHDPTSASSSTLVTVEDGGLDIGSGSATTTVSSTSFALAKTTTNTSGTFYIDPSGNTYSSGTFAFLNTAAASSSIRGSGLVLTDANAGQASSLGFGLVMPGSYICVSASSSKCTPSGAYSSGSVYASFYRATAADVAENFPSSEILEPGDVVTFDNINSQYIKKTTMANEALIAGVVSTMPGVILGNDSPGTYPLALTGRVPVKVSNENGPIQIGDELVASSKPGIAMKYVASSTTSNVGIIGIALETLPSDQTEGKITMFLRGGMTRPIFHEPTSSLTINTNNMNDLIVYNHDIDLLNHSILNVRAIAGMHWSITEDGLLKVERIETAEIQTNKLSITSNGNDTKTAGRGIIPAGVKAVVVGNESVTANAAIFITIHGKENVRWFIADKVPGKSFTLELSDPQPSDISFAYWVVNDIASN